MQYQKGHVGRPVQFAAMGKLDRVLAHLEVPNKRNKGILAQL
jgi:hypothetical protein